MIIRLFDDTSSVGDLLDTIVFVSASSFANQKNEPVFQEVELFMVFLERLERQINSDKLGPIFETNYGLNCFVFVASSQFVLRGLMQFRLKKKSGTVYLTWQTELQSGLLQIMWGVERKSVKKFVFSQLFLAVSSFCSGISLVVFF